MRKLNTILSALLILIFMLHGIMGSFMLVGVASSAGKILAWIGVGILIAHTGIGAWLTVQSFRTAKSQGKSIRNRTASSGRDGPAGWPILVLMFFHIGLFGEVQDGQYILFPFTTVKLVTQLLLIAALFIHIFINIRPLLVSLGIISYKNGGGIFI